MINPESRFSAPAGDLTPGGPSTWHVLDWDQRRLIAVTMDVEQDTEDLAIEHLKKHVDTLPPDAYAIHITPDGNLNSISRNSDDDETTSVYYPPLEKLQPPTSIETVARSDLKEVDRLSPNVDLVSYHDTESNCAKKVVFKYYFLVQFLHRTWNEMNLWMRLPQHPNLVSFDRLVLDELNGHVVGFTSIYIPGGTVEENPGRIFKLEWLKQLTRVVDDLNLKHGIMHQDIAPRNLLVDPWTDNILLFDFDFMGRIGDIGYFSERDDVKGVIFTLYEIITLDTHFGSVPYDQQNPAEVQRLDEWPQHPDVRLDRPVSDYRSMLNEWVSRRENGRRISVYTEAQEPIDWPQLGEPPKKTFVFGVEGNTTTVVAGSWYDLRRSERKKGQVVLGWQRPSHNKQNKVG